MLLLPVDHPSQLDSNRWLSISSESCESSQNALLTRVTLLLLRSITHFVHPIGRLFLFVVGASTWLVPLKRVCLKVPSASPISFLCCLSKMRTCRRAVEAAR